MRALVQNYEKTSVSKVTVFLPLDDGWKNLGQSTDTATWIGLGPAKIQNGAMSNSGASYSLHDTVIHCNLIVCVRSA